jgi:DNA-binding NarL/FixJ family response regulator
MAMAHIKNLIIVDDHEFFRKGVMLTLERFSFIKIIAEASNGLEFMELLKKKPVDIVLMDINMPGMDGVETTKKALEVNPNLKIIALTMFGEEQYLESMIDAGASGFILKNIDAAGLEYALKTVSEGKNYYSPEVMNFFANKRSKKNQTRLTKRETEILEYVAKGLTNQQIANTLYVSLRTITNHRANMHKKVGVKNTIGLLSWAIKQNIIKKI